MSLTKESLFAFVPNTKQVELPEGRGIVVVRELKASEVMDFSAARTTDPANALYKMIITATLDEDGNPLFTSSDKESISKLPYQVTNAIVNEILELSGLGDDESKKKQDKPDAPK